MSVKPLDTTRLVDATPERRPAQSTGNDAAFTELLAMADRVYRSGKSPEKAAGVATLLSLDMMRTALDMDGAPASRGGDRAFVSAVLEAYASGQKPEAAPVKAPEGTAAAAAPVAPAADVKVPHAAKGPAAVESIVKRASERYGVDAALIKAVIQVESDFNPRAVSPVGARGLMQLMPATAAGLGVTDPFDPEQNVMAGTRFLKDMLNRYNGHLDKALAAYNWGPGNVDRGKTTMPRETREYLVKVKQLYAENSLA